MARPALVSLVLLAAVAMPAQAHAAISLTSVQLQPSSKAGGAHPDLTIDTAFSEDPSSDDLKSLRVVLPQGLVGDPSAADRCSQSAFGADSCPAGSKVGTAQLSAVVTVPPGIDVSQTSPGDLYILQPQGAEAARLGLIVRPPPIGVFSLPKIFLQAPIEIGPDTNYGLATTLDNVPRTEGSFDIRVTESKLTLNGMGAHGPFLTNPTNCRQATTTVSATSYDQPGTANGNASFTPTDCDKLPFAPRLSGTVGGAGLTSLRGSPTLTATIAMDPGQANVSSTKVTLPTAVGPNLSQLGRVCASAAFAAGNCPPNARVGSATASSPLLPAPLTGPVLLVAPAGPGLPQLVIQLGGAFPLTLVGDIGLENSRVTNSFTGLPDLPLATFQLTVDGGAGILTNVADLCAPGAGATLDGSLVAQSGRTATASGPLVVKGCIPGKPAAVDKPRASMSVRFGRSSGVLVVHLKAGRGAPPLSRAQLTLAPGLKAGRSGLDVSAAVKLGRRALRVRGRTLDARLKGPGAAGVSILWRGIKPSRKIASKLASRPQLSFVVRLTDFQKRTTKLRVPIRPVLAR